MSIVSKKYFVNNEIPLQFNTNSFEVTTINSDNLSGLSLDVSGQSNLNNLDVIGNLNSVNIVNSGNLITNTITSSGLVTCSNGLSSTSINNSGNLITNTITSNGLMTCSNGLTVTTGTIGFAANSVGLAMVNGLVSRLTKLDNLTGSVAINSSIVSNVLTINYTTNNGQAIFVTPTANFSLVLSGVPTTAVNAIYKLKNIL